MNQDVLGFLGLSILFVLLWTSWWVVKIAHKLDDLYDVFNDEDQECLETAELPGVLPGMAGHVHSCAYAAGHPPPHRCPVCRLDWTAPRASGGPIRTGVPYIVGDQDGGAR